MSLLHVTATIFLLSGFYVVKEVAKRKLGLETRHTRKAAHVISGIVAIGLAHVLTQIEFIIVCLFFTLFFLISRSHNLLTSIHTHVRITYGEIAYPLGLAFAAAAAYHSPFVITASFLILAVSDTLAEVLGDAQKPKSLRGSVAFLLSSCVILLTTYLIFFGVIGVISAATLLLVGFAATIIEYISTKGLDNFFIPTAVTLLLLGAF